MHMGLQHTDPGQNSPRLAVGLGVQPRAPGGSRGTGWGIRVLQRPCIVAPSCPNQPRHHLHACCSSVNYSTI